MFIFLTLLLFIVSLILHELGHGVLAHLFGDITPKNNNKLTLNPLVHITTGGTLILPMACILFLPGIYLGWAKPIYVNPYNLKYGKIGIVIVSMGGVITNLILVFISAILLHFFSNPFLGEILSLLIEINVFLFLFNLVIFPNSDSFNTIVSLLPPDKKMRFLAKITLLFRFRPIITFILLAVFLFFFFDFFIIFKDYIVGLLI